MVVGSILGGSIPIQRNKIFNILIFIALIGNGVNYNNNKYSLKLCYRPQRPVCTARRRRGASAA